MDITSKLGTMERRVAAFDVRRALDSPLLDVALGLGLFFFALVQLGAFRGDLGPIGMLAVGLATLPHTLRRRHPVETVTLTAIGAITLLFFERSVSGNIFGLGYPVYVSGLLSAYTVFRVAGRRTAWLLGAASSAGAFLVVWYLGPHRIDLALAGAALPAATTLLADLRRSRNEVREARVDNLEALREQAAMAERARIAREMHDIVAHSISMIAVQAETAPYTIADLGDDGRKEFAEIAATARGTLTEMRRLLGVLRADAPPETAPQPGLARLPELIERHGGEVDLDMVGVERELPQAVDVSAYRIIQEALTNARQHAPGARVSIEIAYRPALLALRIADDGPGPATAERTPVERTPAEQTPAGKASGDANGGHGLIGMRERATALGGWFVAGPGPDGGFLIRAGLPTE
ncbi:histidine kinase [Microbispora sp. NPDC046933]|uniref:sensor histidine kinase n=1 Tax=Microbispora sp. NPDC046933 TaxID=3155618 RepID=UPI003400CC30